MRQLRRSKTEIAYAEWMAGLKAKYPVEIDQTVLTELLAETTDAGKASAGQDR